MSATPGDVSEEIATLTEALLGNVRRLEELTGGEVDTVMDREGHTFLLQRAQEQLRRSEAAKQSAILNALPAHIALLDTRGVIISVNEPWQKFSSLHVLPDNGEQTGINYLEICDGARGDDASDAHNAAAGIRSVLSGKAKSFSFEYPCHSQTEQRWFVMSVMPLAGDPPSGAVVMHIDVTAERQATLALQESELRFRQMAENTREMFSLRDPVSNKFLYLSPAYEVIYGRSRESLYADPESWADSIHADDRESIVEQVRVAEEASKVCTLECRVVRPDGSIRWVEANSYPIRDNAGRMVRIAAVTEDITEKKLAAQALRESEALFSEAFENAPIGKALVAPDGHWLKVNRTLCEMVGYSQAELLAGTFQDITYHEDLKTDLEYVRQMLLEGEISTYQMEKRYVHAQGHLVPALVSVALVRDQQDRPRYFISQILDITARKKAEIAIFESEREQRKLVEQIEKERARLVAAQRVAKVGSWETDLTTMSVIWSEETYRIFETDNATFRGDHQSFLEFVHPDDRNEVDEAFKASVNQRGACTLEHRLLLPEGRAKIVEERWQVVFDEQGKPVHAIGTTQDITERKQNEEVLRESEERFSSAFEHAPIGVALVLINGGCLKVNCAFCEMLGYTQTEMLSRSIQDITHPENIEEDIAASRELITREKDTFQRETRYIHALGDIVIVLVSVAMVRSSDGQPSYFVAQIQDITQRKQAERLLVDSQQRLSLATESARIGIWDWDVIADSMLWDKQMYTLYGIHEQDFSGAVDAWQKGLHPEDRDRAEAELATALSGSTKFNSEFRIVWPNGEVHHIEAHAQVQRADNGSATRMTGVNWDVTERKRDQEELHALNAELEARVYQRTAELNAAREEAEEANQAKSLFLATMSHEIRTPMNGVIGMLDVLHQTSLHSEQVEMVDLIRDSAYSLLDIIEDVLDLSKIEAGKLQLEEVPIQLAEVVEKACLILDRMAIKQDIGMAMFIDPAIPPMVMGDETRLRQVLINMTGNAIKFSSGGDRPGQVSVRAELVKRQGQSVTVDLIVADNGIGMDEATIARVFTPFSQADVSTTRRFGGTGLGLSISRMLVDLMGGEISVRSAPNLGSTFTVRLHFTETAGNSVTDNLADTMQAIAAGLHCRIIGSEQPLAKDLGVYLSHAGATVEWSPDLVAAAAAEPMPGLCLWLILPGQSLPEIADLRAMATGSPATETRFVVLGNGKRRQPRRIATDLVYLDIAPLFRKTFFEALELASGRAQNKTSNGQDYRQVPHVKPLSWEEAQRQGRLILVAEDSEINQKVILKQLELIGYTAKVVNNGQEALESWRKGNFGLLLTDLHMPKMDGYELTTAIRAQEPPGRHIPIIALTANALREEEWRCLALGMDAYLTKPIRLPILKQTIDAWLNAAAEPKPGQGETTAPAAERLVVDLKVLTMLVGDDPKVIGEMLQVFRRSVAQSSRELSEGVANRALDAVAAAAHKLKSAARSIGAHSLGELCASLQQTAEAGRIEELHPQLAAFLAELEAVNRFLDSLHQNRT